MLAAKSSSSSSTLADHLQRLPESESVLVSKKQWVAGSHEILFSKWLISIGK